WSSDVCSSDLAVVEDRVLADLGVGARAADGDAAADVAGDLVAADLRAADVAGHLDAVGVVGRDQVAGAGGRAADRVVGRFEDERWDAGRVDRDAVGAIREAAGPV